MCTVSAAAVNCPWPLRPLATTRRLGDALDLLRAAGVDILHAGCTWSMARMTWDIDGVSQRGMDGWCSCDDIERAIDQGDQVRLGLMALNFSAPVTLLQTTRGNQVQDRLCGQFRPTQLEAQTFVMALGGEIAETVDGLLLRPNQVMASGSPEQIMLREQCARAVVGEMVLMRGRLPSRTEWRELKMGTLPSRLAMNPLITLMLSRRAPSIEILAGVMLALERICLKWRGATRARTAIAS